MTTVNNELPSANTNCEGSQELADLASIVQELGSIMEICSRLLELLKINSNDHVLIESYWTTALIKYARCFASGKRFNLTEDIFCNLQGDAKDVHKYYIDLRSKHIAHSVNPFEQMAVDFVLSPFDSKEKKIEGVAVLAMRHIVSNEEGVRQLGMLSKIALKKACSLSKEYEEKVLDEGRKLSIDELYKTVRSRLTVSGSGSASRPR